MNDANITFDIKPTAFEALVLRAAMHLAQHHLPVTYEAVAQRLGIPVWVLQECFVLRDVSEGAS